MRKILYLIGLYASACYAQPPTHQQLDQFNQTLQNFCHAQQFSGAVLIAVNDKIIFERACGWMDKKNHIVNTIYTRYEVSEIRHLFTSMAIAKLVDEQKISLTTRVQSLLPNSQIAPDITIAQLLNHTSGIMDGKKNSSDTLLAFRPGTNQLYSHKNYAILASIIAAVSKQDYMRFINDNLFQPANITSSNYTPNYNDKQATCQWQKCRYNLSIADLYKFSRLIQSNTFLSATSQALLSTQPINTPAQLNEFVSVSQAKLFNLEIPQTFSEFGFAGEWNSFGLAVWHEPDMVGQSGKTDHASTIFVISPTKKFTAIVLSNIKGPGSLLVYKAIKGLLGYSVEINNL